MKLHDASDLKDVEYGCTEYAIKRLTGVDLLKKTGLEAGEIGFENATMVVRNLCKVCKGSIELLLSSRLNWTILRIRPPRQRDLHSVILVSIERDKATIEDQLGRRTVPTGDLLYQWRSAGMLYMSCNTVERSRCKT